MKRLGELFQVSNFNMASNTGAMHGGSRKNSCRKKVFLSRKDCRKSWEKGHKRIYLNLNIFDSWKQAKIVAGYEKSSDSDFAAHLLSLEFSFLFVAHELLQLQLIMLTCFKYNNCLVFLLFIM